MDKKKILIVDDDPHLLKTLTVRLRAHNYATVVAQDAISAISQAANENPDLIILDLGLPAGDGFVVMERLNNIISLAATPIIVLSARDVWTNKERALKAGARAFLQKPADKNELIALIQSILAESIYERV